MTKRLNVNIEAHKYRMLKMRAISDEITLSDLVNIWIDCYIDSESMNALRADSK